VRTWIIISAVRRVDAVDDLFVAVVEEVRQVDAVDDLCVAVVEEKPRGLRSVVADELKVRVPETAGADAEGVVEGNVAARHGTVGARGGRRDGHVASSPSGAPE